MTEISVENIRQAILDALPQDVAQHTDEIAPTRLYLPPAHVRALRLESQMKRRLAAQFGMGQAVRPVARVCVCVCAQQAWLVPHIE